LTGNTQIRTGNMPDGIPQKLKSLFINVQIKFALNHFPSPLTKFLDFSSASSISGLIIDFQESGNPAKASA